MRSSMMIQISLTCISSTIQANSGCPNTRECELELRYLLAIDKVKRKRGRVYGEESFNENMLAERFQFLKPKEDSFPLKSLLIWWFPCDLDRVMLPRVVR